MDLDISETNNGGDLSLKGKDLCVVYGLENMVYLGLFGGNPGFITRGAKNPNEQAFDWWGNNLLMPNNESQQFNSLTEKTLQDVALNSSGRQIIEDAIKKDLAFMSEFAEISIKPSIISHDKIEIFIRVQEPDNLQAKVFRFIWDRTNLDETSCMFLGLTGDFNNDFNIDFY